MNDDSTRSTPHPASGGAQPGSGFAAQVLAQKRLEALTAATSDVVYRMSADWSEMQPLDGRGLVASNDAPVRDWMERNLPADEHARVRAAIARAIADKDLFELEHRVLRPEDADGWTYSRAVPVLDEDGDIIEWFGLARDITEAKRAQATLQESEQRFRAVFEQSTGGIAQVDLDGRYVLVNDRYCAIVGRSREELLTLKMQDLTHPEDLDVNLSLFAELVHGHRSSVTIEKRYLRPDGSEVWAQNSVSAVRGSNGDVRFITAMVADISDLRGAKERQSALAAQRQLALDAARLGWWQYEPATGVVSHDARYAEIYGIPGAGPRHVDEIKQLLHPEDAPRLWAAVEAAARPVDPVPYAVEYRIRRPDGAVRWLEARGIASFEGRGAQRVVSSFVGTVGDVTERRVAEEVLRENEARFRLMADASPAALWLTDPRGHCTFLSRQWYETTGQTEQEALGIGWTKALHPEEQERAAAAFLQANAARTFYQSEFRLRTSDGTYHWAIDLGRPWFSEDGQYAGMVGVVFDIDARKRAEQALAEASQRKDQFLATLAHELRNPLAPISNALQLWPLLDHQPEEEKKLRAMMGRQVKQMVHLIDDLLDVSRITRGRIELRPERLDLRAALEAALEAQRPFLESHRHQLTMDVSCDPLLVDADLGRLVQIFGNVLHNAIKYTPTGGKIRLTAQRAGEQVLVSVADNGAGIPGEMLTSIFEIFTQVDQSLGRTHGGLGIGLTLVKNLVELHGGQVEARSEGMGRGSEFVVRLPLAPGVVDVVPASAPPHVSLQPLLPRRVLVVDDVEASANTFALLLEGLGQEALAVYSGEAATRAMQEFAPQVAFVDIAMPGMDGYEVARQIRATLGARPVLVALTGYGQEEDRRRAMAAGFDHHLVKPASVDAVHALLRTLPRAEPVDGQLDAHSA